MKDNGNSLPTHANIYLSLLSDHWKDFLDWPNLSIKSIKVIDIQLSPIPFPKLVLCGILFHKRLTRDSMTRDSCQEMSKVVLNKVK